MRVLRQRNRACGLAVTISVVLTAGMLVAATVLPAYADPVLVPPSGEGADLPASAVLALPTGAHSGSRPHHLLA